MADKPLPLHSGQLYPYLPNTAAGIPLDQGQLYPSVWAEDAAPITLAGRSATGSRADATLTIPVSINYVAPTNATVTSSAHTSATVTPSATLATVTSKTPTKAVVG